MVFCLVSDKVPCEDSKWSKKVLKWSKKQRLMQFYFERDPIVLPLFSDKRKGLEFGNIPKFQSF